MSNKRFYVTTPIYYVNGVPHVGTATSTLLADATTRYMRLRGHDAYFLTGTDEHAQKVADAAAAVGQETQAFVDEISQAFVRTWKFLRCDYSNFIRTSEPRHKTVVQEIFRRLQTSGDVYLGEYEGWYSVADETFYRDTDVTANGVVKESGAKVERIREEVHYFRLSAYGDRLKAHIEANSDFLLPETRRNEVLAFIDQGLRDIAITRKSAGWGIEVPNDPGKVIYVWFDALINYLTESGWPNDPNWDLLWPADAHLMAKEIYTRFHATLWPAMLMALNLPLPKHVVGHGWWVVLDPDTGELGKGSKTKGNIPLPQDVVAGLLESAPGLTEPLAIDALRYYLLRDIRFSDDAEFSLAMLGARYNADLGNDLGNVLNRVLKAGYYGGTIPTPTAHAPQLVAAASDAISGYEAALARFDWGAALASVWPLFSAVNVYLAETAPWKAAKAGETEAVATSIYNALEGVRLGAYLVAPAMAEVARAVYAQLGLPDPLGNGSWNDNARFGALVPGTKTGDAFPLFPRLDPKLLAGQPVAASMISKKSSEKKTEPKMSETPTPAAETPTSETTPDSIAETVSDEITIDDFFKVQLRVADILAVEKVEKAKKLLKLRIKIGDEERQIVSGIAEVYEPEDLVGKQIVVVYNLKPATIRGVESRGMLLAASDADGNAVILHPDKPVASGSQVR